MLYMMNQIIIYSTQWNPWKSLIILNVFKLLIFYGRINVFQIIKRPIIISETWLQSKMHMKCLRQKNPKSNERNITSKLIRFLEELPTVMLKLVFSFLFFLSKMPCSLAHFQINTIVVGRVSPTFHSVLWDTWNLFKMLLYLKYFFKKLVNRY